MVDNVTILNNCCDSERPELDLIEFLNQMGGMSERDESVAVALGVNRDLLETGSL